MKNPDGREEAGLVSDVLAQAEREIEERLRMTRPLTLPELKQVAGGLKFGCDTQPGSAS